MTRGRKRGAYNRLACNCAFHHGGHTFVDVGVEVAVLLGVGSGLAVVVVDKDALFSQELHLLLVQVVCGDLRHSDCRLQVSHLTAAAQQHNEQADGSVNRSYRIRSSALFK